LQKKIIYVLLDGIGDLPHPDLNGLTPLEAAHTPNLDIIAQNGVSGEVTSVGKGIAPQSDIAVFNMLGYSFKDHDYVGRGVVECLGCNIDFKEGDLALRGNFATIDQSKRIIDRRAGRNISPSDANEVCNIIQEIVKIKDIEFFIKPTIGHRVIVNFRKKNGEKLGDNITNTDPAYDKINGIGVAKKDQDEIYITESKDKDRNSKFSAEIVNSFTNQVIDILRNSKVNKKRIDAGLLPINCILLRDAGNRYPHIQPINDKFKLNFASLVDMPVEIGISKILGMKPYDAGNTNEYGLKSKILVDKINNHDFMYVHLKGPDEFGHDGNAFGKKESIEEIDTQFFKPLIEELNHNKDSDINFIISGDHSTPCIKKAHTDDPIPLLVSGRNIVNDGTSRFTEKYASKGKIGKILGFEVIQQALDLFKK
jgi:2,3-bisphosphoglycerate-independent phosphoglycerate mutase